MLWLLMLALLLLTCLLVLWPLLQSAQRSYGLVASIVTLIIAASTLGYAALGNPEALGFREKMAEQHRTAPDQGNSSADLTVMLQSLEQKLKTNPDDLDGWLMLGRSYRNLQRYPEAEAALMRVIAQRPQDLEALLILVDVKLMNPLANKAAETEPLIRQALQLAPQDTTALWLAGMVAMRLNQPQQAQNYWSTLLPLLKDEPQLQAEVQGLLERLNQPQTKTLASAAKPNSAAAPAQLVDPNSIQVTVRLSDELAAKAAPTDTVFIYARAQDSNAPPMPVAVHRVTVQALPITVVLNDSMAMTPAAVLSQFQHFKVGARISSTGKVSANAKDWMSEQQGVSLGAVIALVVHDNQQK